MGNAGSVDSHCPGGLWTGRMTTVLCGPQSPCLSQEAECIVSHTAFGFESKCCPSCERQNHHLLPPSQPMPVTLPGKAGGLPSEMCVQHCSYSATFPPKSSFAVSARSPVANTSHRNGSKSKTLYGENTFSCLPLESFCISILRCALLETGEYSSQIIFMHSSTLKLW